MIKRFKLFKSGVNKPKELYAFQYDKMFKLISFLYGEKKQQ